MRKRIYVQCRENTPVHTSTGICFSESLSIFVWQLRTHDHLMAYLMAQRRDSGLTAASVMGASHGESVQVCYDTPL